MVALALAELSLRRPGWADWIERVANDLELADLVVGFRQTSADLIQPVSLLGSPKAS